MLVGTRVGNGVGSVGQCVGNLDGARFFQGKKMEGAVGEVVGRVGNEVGNLVGGIGEVVGREEGGGEVGS